MIVRRQGGLGGAAKGAGSAGSAGAGGGEPDSSSASGESGSSLRNYYDVLYVQMPGAVLLILLLNDSITIDHFIVSTFQIVCVCLSVWLAVCPNDSTQLGNVCLPAFRDMYLYGSFVRSCLLLHIKIIF